MVPDQKEWAPELAGEWVAGKAAAAAWVAAAPELARAAIASARNVERPLRTRQVFPAFRYAVRNAASK